MLGLITFSDTFLFPYRARPHRFPADVEQDLRPCI